MHGFSTRMGGKTRVYRPELGGDLNLGFTPHDDPAIVRHNRELFIQAVGGAVGETALITLKQVHSALVLKLETADVTEQSNLPKGDGWMTDRPGLLLGIQTADCIPVLLADRRKRVVAAFHAGWRGTLQRIVERGVGQMRVEFGCRPEDLTAAIGPGIGRCCYSVGEEVRHEFESQFHYAAELFCEVSDSEPIKMRYPLLFLTARAPGHSNLGPSLHLDLAEANRRQLLAAGLKAAEIHLAAECTSCDTHRFFSHRKERGFTGRMLSVIGIRP
jgi:YfiH family protein